MSDDLLEFLNRSDRTLRSLIRRHGRRALLHESIDDLVQGVHLRALRAVKKSGQQPKAPQAWLNAVAHRYLADRLRYWSALRRESAGALRVTTTTREEAMSDGGVHPPASGPGPKTFAERREMLEIAVRALAALPPRDRDLVRWANEDVPLEEQALRTQTTYAAVQRASLRARDRFRKTFELLLRRPRSAAPDTRS